jgi:hypothetical protein
MNRSIHTRAPQPAQSRTRTLVARPGRLAAAGLAVITLTAALLLLWAASAQAAVWVIPAMSRAFPDTEAGGRQSIDLDAAGNEYQGVQVCIRGGGDHNASLSWQPGSDPLITGNTKLHRVYYVNVSTPTTGLGSRRGPYPDPLVPRDFGEQLGVPGSTTPFYLLTHVPYGTPAGRYAATLHVQNGSESVDIPFNLRVWGFGWTEISTSTAFAVSQGNLERSVAGGANWNSAEVKRRVLTAFYGMMADHGLSPTVVHYLPKVSASGNAATRAWADKVAPLLDKDGLSLHDNQLPFLRWFPWSRSKNPSSGQIDNYLTDMCRAYKDRGWHDKAYIYVLDETTTTREERQAERLARIAHKASARSGYRVRFLLTDDPRPTDLGGVKTRNTFLYDDVDIWTLRYYYFFGRIPAVRERQRAGKEIWWYSYTNGAVRRTPSFVIDKPHIDSRAWGWLMEEWDVDGLLNWGFNRWGKPTTGEGWRDPYQNPLSLTKGRLRSNGCTSLIYPGYYPRYGLKDPYAPPVSSLRLEALRDGLEEREYLRLAKAAGGGGQALAEQVLGRITQFPYKIQQKNVFNFPKYTSSNDDFDAARTKLAEFLEAQQAQR